MRKTTPEETEVLRERVTATVAALGLLRTARLTGFSRETVETVIAGRAVTKNTGELLAGRLDLLEADAPAESPADAR